MTVILKDRVRETTTVTGTGPATLLGAVTGYQAFSVVGDTNTCYYTIADQQGSNWEVGIGTYSTTGPTLTRTTVLASSSGGAAVNFTSGTKDVFLTQPAEKAVTTQQMYTPDTFAGTFTNGVAIDYTSGLGRISVGASDGIAFYNGGVANTERVRISSAGYVGIGTNAPAVPLEVIGTTGTVTAPTYTNQTVVALKNNFHIRFGAVNPSNTYEFSLQRYNAGAAYPTNAFSMQGGIGFTWSYSDGTIAPAEQMRLDVSGNLGVGTSSPGRKLSVVGSPQVVATFLSTNTISTQVRIMDYNAVEDAGLTFQTFPTGSIISSGNGSTLKVLTFQTAATERMRIDTTGLVGIGTASPSTFGAKLNVIQSSSTAYALYTQAPSSGGTIGNTSNMVFFGDTRGTTNDGFKFYAYRFATGGTWENQTMRIERNIDGVQSCGIVEFGPSSLDFYANNSAKVFTINSGGTTTYGTGSPIAAFIGNNANNYIAISDNNGVNFANFGAIAGANAYIYSAGYNAFYAGTAERMRIDSSGNVGVGGTPNGNSKLQVFQVNNNYGFEVLAATGGLNSGVASIRLLNATNTVDRLSFYGQSDTLSVITAANTLAFNTASAERMRIDSNGNVGIGTVSPAQKLEVVGRVRVTSAGVGDASSVIEYKNNTGNVAYNYLDVSRNFVWNVSGAENMRISSAGYLGIATTTPQSLLTVYGPTGVTSDSTGEATGLGSIRIANGSSALTSDGGLEFKNAGDSNGYGSKIQALNSTGSQLVFANRNASATWTERMRISSSGGVSIGTSTDAGGGNLLVQGKITSNGGVVINSNVGLLMPSTNNPPLQLVPNVSTVQGAAIVNNWAAGANTGILIGTSEAGGVAMQVAKSIPITSGLPTGGGTALMTVNASGTVVLAGGSTSTTGTGITFPATQAASTDVNTLDDYEEGTWTPTWTGAGGNPTITYTTQSGVYTKIGNLVFISCRITVNTVSGGSGVLKLSGLPFSGNGGPSGWYPAAQVAYKNGWSTNGPDYGRVVGTSIEIYKSNNTGETTITPANLTAGTDFIMTATYVV